MPDLARLPKLPSMLPVRAASSLLLFLASAGPHGAAAALPMDPKANGRDSPTANASVQVLAPLPHQPDLPPLKAVPGMTALAGRVVGLDGLGLVGVRVGNNSETTLTDAQGRWVLAPVPVGASVLRLDARRAGPKQDQDHGMYEVRAVAQAGQTSVLPWVSWLALIDHAHDVQIASPTTAEVVVRTPAIPDLELHIPAGMVVRNVDGQPVTRIGITAVPFDRLPFPVPATFRLPMFFTIQPGAACFYTAAGGVAAATLRYPNWRHELPRARATFWRYEPDGNGWAPHGMGAVSADGRQVVPDPGVEITDLGSAECDSATRSHMDPPVHQDLRRLNQGGRSAATPPGASPPVSASPAASH